MEIKYRNPLYYIDSNFVLCGSSSLEFMGYFSGYTQVSEIFVYAVNTSICPQFGVNVIGPLDNIRFEESCGVKYTTFEQTINDMLRDERLEDPQAIMEALNEYLYQYENPEPQINPENHEKYLMYKDLCKDNYSGG